MLVLHSNFYYGILCLTDEEKQNPNSVIQEFFEDFRLDESKQVLADCIRVCISTDNTTYDTGNKRSNLMFLHEKINRLIEAAYLLKENNNYNFQNS